MISCYGRKTICVESKGKLLLRRPAGDNVSVLASRVSQHNRHTSPRSLQVMVLPAFALCTETVPVSPTFAQDRLMPPLIVYHRGRWFSAVQTFRGT